jgi:transposase
MMDGSKGELKMTAGLDLGDRYSHLCLIDTQSGEVIEESKLRTTSEAFQRRFGSERPRRIAIEAGTHSPWTSRVLEGYGHQVLVANAHKRRLIYGQGGKTDRIDAEKLARLARLDPKLLAPIGHRSESSQAHPALIRSREALVRNRARLINHVRFVVKPFGHHLPKCSTQGFHKKVPDRIPKALKPALEPILQTIGELTARIREYDRRLTALAEELYPETKLLEQVQGVELLTALAFVLIVEDPARFANGQAASAYAGLVPGKDQSGESDPQQRISRHGNELLRRLLVGCAHYVLGPFGQDSDLRRHGEKIAERGGKNARKRAIVAVARKLAVLLHRLWIAGEVYDPVYNARRAGERAAS